MDTRELSYFIAAAEELHISRAALRVNVSQPSISRAIFNIEAELQTSLFDRQGKSIILTRAGEALYQSAVPLLARFNDLSAIARRAARGATNTIRVGYAPTAVFMGVPETIEYLKKSNPDINIILIESRPDIIPDALRSGDLDVAITFSAAAAP